MGAKTTAHRPSQAHLHYVVNSHGNRVINTAYQPSQRPRASRTVSPPRNSLPAAQGWERRNSEALAWYRHEEVTQHVNVDSDYESDSEHMTPQEKAKIAIERSGVTLLKPGSRFDGELPPSHPFESRYAAPRRSFLIRKGSAEERSRQHWLIERSHEWLGGLTEAEQQAVIKWTRSGHQLIGEYLEGDHVPSDESADSIREFHRILTGALDKQGAVLDEPIHVYRGIDSEFLFDEDAEIPDIASAAEYILNKFRHQKGARSPRL